MCDLSRPGDFIQLRDQVSVFAEETGRRTHVRFGVAIGRKDEILLSLLEVTLAVRMWIIMRNRPAG